MGRSAVTRRAWLQRICFERGSTVEIGLKMAQCSAARGLAAPHGGHRACCASFAGRPWAASPSWVF